MICESAALNIPANLENSEMATGLEMVSFHSNPQERNAKECSNYCTTVLISLGSKIMLKILQARLQQYTNWEIPDVQAGFRKGRWTRDQIANNCWIMERARVFQKNTYLCFTDYTKTFDCVDHNKLWKILKKMCIPDHLTCLLSNLYAGQEATVRTGHGKMDWFQIGKGVHQSCILLSCLFNLYTECMCAKSFQKCLTLCHPMDYSPLGSSVHGVLQARILEWVAMLSSSESFQPRDQTWVS